MCSSIKTVKDGAIQLSCVGSKKQDVSSAVAYIKPNTTTSLDSIARQMTKLILLDLKQRKANCTHIYSNAQTIIVITKQTLTSVCSKNISLIVNSIVKQNL